MIGSLKVLALIPARGGSKRVPRKNILKVGGKPLIEWTVRAARKSRYIDHLAVSSDDDTILDLARQLGCDTALRRPAALASDEAPGIDPVLHALEALPGYDVVVLLQPTSPLRRPADIDACLEKCSAPGASACVSVTPSREKPEWLVRIDERGRMVPLISGNPAQARERAGQLYLFNGAVYATRVSWLFENREFITPQTRAHVMPEEFSLDIDTPFDLALADFMLQRDAGS